MTKSDVANLKVRLGDHLIKTAGETEVFESKAARVVRHKEFTQQTLVRLVVSLPMSVLTVSVAAQGRGHHQPEDPGPSRPA